MIFELLPQLLYCQDHQDDGEQAGGVVHVVIFGLAQVNWSSDGQSVSLKFILN